mgnify:FL=1
MYCWFALQALIPLLVRYRWFVAILVMIVVAWFLSGRPLLAPTSDLVIANASSDVLRRVQVEVIRGMVPEEFAPKTEAILDGVTVVATLAPGERRTTAYNPRGDFAVGILLERASGKVEHFVIGYCTAGDLEITIEDGGVTYEGTGLFDTLNSGSAFPAGPISLSSLPQATLWEGRDITDEGQLPTAQQIDAAADATEYQLHSYMDTIDALQPAFEKRRLTVAGCAEAAGWYAPDGLRLLECQNGGETWREERRLYIVSDRPIGMRRASEHLDGTYETSYRRVRSRATEDLVYFNGASDIDDPLLTALLAQVTQD